MSNGNTSWHESVPIWAKTLAFLIGTVGMPALISIYFMAQDAGYIGSTSSRNEQALQRIESSLGNGLNSMKETVEQRTMLQRKALFIAEQTCRNSSRTELQLQGCNYWKDK